MSQTERTTTRNQETEVACEASYHEGISQNSQTVLAQQCEHLITAAKQRSGNICPSVCSPKWGQCTVKSQTNVGQGRGETKCGCIFVDVSKSVSSCLWREDGGGGQLGSTSQLWQENSCWEGEGKEGKGGRRGGLSVEHAQSFPSST